MRTFRIKGYSRAYPSKAALRTQIARKGGASVDFDYNGAACSPEEAFRLEGIDELRLLGASFSAHLTRRADGVWLVDGEELRRPTPRPDASKKLVAHFSLDDALDQGLDFEVRVDCPGCGSELIGEPDCTAVWCDVCQRRVTVVNHVL